MKRVLLLTVVVCLAALSLPAQEGPPVNLSRGYHIIVKQGHSAEFEAGFKMHVQWRKAHNDPWGWRSGSSTRVSVWAGMSLFQAVISGLTWIRTMCQAGSRIGM